MRRIAGFFRLARSDRRLLIRAATALLSAKLAVRIMSLPAARRALIRLQRPGRLPARASQERIVWAVQAAGRAIPGMSNCLVQAMAAEAILMRAGYPCEMRIGAARDGPARLIAHAWLESGGKVLIGEIGLDRYTLLTAPESSEASRLPR